MARWKYRPFLGLESGDLLASTNVNKYRAVVATAKIARRLNNVNAKEEEFDESQEAERTLEAHKVTSIALEMLLKGEIEFYPSKKPEPVPVAAAPAPKEAEPEPIASLDVESVPLAKPEENSEETSSSE